MLDRMAKLLDRALDAGRVFDEERFPLPPLVPPDRDALEFVEWNLAEIGRAHV